MPQSDYTFDEGVPIDVGQHGQHDFVFESGEPVPDTGESGLVYEAGVGLGGGFVSANAQYLADVNNTGLYEVTPITTEPVIEWRAPIGGVTSSRPVADDQYVYICTSSGIYKVAKSTGAIVAQSDDGSSEGTVALNAFLNEVYVGDPTTGHIYDASLSKKGTIDGGRYLTVDFGNDQMLFTSARSEAYEISTLSKLWSHSANRPGPSVIHNGDGFHHFHSVPRDFSRVDETGAIWSLAFGDRDRSGSCYDPVEDLIYLIGDGSIWALEPDGTFVWDSSINAPDGRQHVTQHNSMVLVVDDGGTLHACDGATGNDLFETSLNGDTYDGSGVTGTPGVAYASGRGNLHAVDKSTGDILWDISNDDTASDGETPLPDDEAIYTTRQNPDEFGEAELIKLVPP